MKYFDTKVNNFEQNINSKLNVKHFLEGVKSMLPFILSAIPMAMIAGALGITNGLTNFQTLLLAMLANSGTIQFVVYGLLQESISWPVILLSVLILNSRMMIYSIILRDKIKDIPKNWKFIMGFGLIDALFFIFIERFKNNESLALERMWFYLGGSFSIYIAWIISTIIGIILGNTLLHLLGSGVDFPMTALYIAILASYLVDKKTYFIAITAGFIAVSTKQFPYGINIIISTFTGIFVGIIYNWIMKIDISQTDKES